MAKVAKHKDIDGGYAWIILFSAFFSIGLGQGSRNIFGILYIEILDLYEAGEYMTSWIITLQTVFWGLSGTVVGAMLHRFGAKTGLIICALLGSGGFIISAFSYNIYILFVTFGVMCGTAQAFAFVGGASILYFYFEERRGLTTSVYAIGAPVTGMTLTYVMPYLLEQYGYRGATLLMGGICLHGIPLAMLMRDPSYLKETNEMVPLVSKQQSDNASLNSRDNSETERQNEKSELPEVYEDKTCSTEKQTSGQLICSLLSDRFGLHLCRDWMFIMFMISYATTLLSHMSLHWFIPHRAVEIGFSEDDAAMTVTVVNLSNIFSRVLLGLVISDKFFCEIVTLTLYVFISGLTTILAIFCTNYWSYMIFSALFGLLRGMFLIYVLLISVHLVGKSQVDLALGLIFSLAGLVFLVFIPLFGHLNEVTESYATTFILYGSIELFGGLFLVTIPIYLFVKKITSSKIS